MVSKLFGVFGDSNDRQVKRLRPVVDKINSLEPEYQQLSDDELRGKTDEFRRRLEDGKTTLDDLLPEAFAAVREASLRTIGLRHFDVQLMGGMVLHQGKVAEMKTGEGKTLVATLPLYLNALEGQGVHLVTVNDYLSRRDAAWMGPVYHALGLTVGCLQHEASLIFEPDAPAEKEVPAGMRRCTRAEAYLADITYGTNNEFGFDYLRDHMATAKEQQVQGELNFAIVDEVDNILIDEARTPLIISGPAEDSADTYRVVAQVVPRLEREVDYKIEEKERHVVLTEEGIGKIERLLKVDNLYAPENFALTHFVENALRAQVIYLRDRDYVLQNGEVVIVDEFTGRLMPGRRWADGLHQAVEAKEGVPIQRETITYATVTLQNYFRMYDKLAGMTGTAVTEAEEFFKVYKLEVVAMPPNRLMTRQDLPDLVYKTEGAKFKAVIDEIIASNNNGRPVLIGTVSIERSELLSEMLRRRGVAHEVLNAKNHEREAQIVAEAGRPGAVTVSTNMAGRGTDIILGGDPSTAESREAWEAAHESVVANGGLYVVGTERHESRRIDNQLRGRSGRQGDPGTTRFYGSLEDDILKRFGSGLMGRLVSKGIPDDVPLESGMLTKTLEMVQAKVEAYYFDIRKQLVDYDDVVNRHREVVYAERQKILDGADLKANILEMLGDEIASLVRTHLVGEPNDWAIDTLLAELTTILPLPQDFDEDFVLSQGKEEVEEAALDAVESLYTQREEQFTEPVMRAIERVVMLQTIDRLWVQHLTLMSNLRQGIGLHAYGQRDPLVMYKKEGHDQFQMLLERIRHDIVHMIFHVAPAQPQSGGQATATPTGSGSGAPAAAPVPRAAAVDTSKPITVMSKVAAGASAKAAPASTKIGRNDPCYCGSGKKYKRCHGAAA